MSLRVLLKKIAWEPETLVHNDGQETPARAVFLVRRATGHGGGRWLMEEGHRKVAQIEKPSVDTLALLQVLQNPLRGLFRETALAGASDNDGNYGHVVDPCCSLNGRYGRISDRGSLFFSIETIVRIDICSTAFRSNVRHACALRFKLVELTGACSLHWTFPCPLYWTLPCFISGVAGLPTQQYRRVSNRVSLYFSIQTIASDDIYSTAFRSTSFACSLRQPMKEAFRRAGARCGEGQPSSAKPLRILGPHPAASCLLAPTRPPV